MTRHNNFDALRLMGAMFVLVSHQSPFVGEPEWHWMDLNLGTIGVLMFFSISGYLVAGSWRADPDLGRFLAKRFLRIVPGLLVAMTLTEAIVGVSGISFTGNIKALNPSLWTIRYEIYCYVLLACAALLTTRFIPLLAIGTGAAYLVLPFDNLSWLGLFFICGALHQEYPALRTWRAAALMSAVGVGAYLLTGNTILLTLLIIPSWAIWIGTQSWPVAREAGRYGDLSYGIYIYACPIQHFALAAFPSVGYGGQLTMAITASVAVAWLSWTFVEKPAMLRKPRGQSVQAGPSGPIRLETAPAASPALPSTSPAA